MTGLLLVANCSSGKFACHVRWLLLVGAALAISGAVMQALFENPLAEPGLLASLTAQAWGLCRWVLLTAQAVPNWALGLCAIAGALIITLILLRFARRHLSTVGYCWLALHSSMFSALMTWLSLPHLC
ncbi:iron chelate uptake ABC transporter family permease subunit [Escherichia coli]